MDSNRIDDIKNKLHDDEISDAQKALKNILKWHDAYRQSYPNSERIFFGDKSATAMAKECKMGMGSFTFYNTNPTTSLYPPKPTPIPAEDIQNWTLDKFSIVTVYEVDGKRILIPADIYKQSEDIMLTRDKVKDCDVIHMSHHGSVNGNSSAFVDYVIGNTKETAAIMLPSSQST